MSVAYHTLKIERGTVNFNGMPNAMRNKILRRNRMASPIPKNVLVKQEEESVVLTFKMTVTPKHFGEDKDDLEWKDKVWKALKTLQNLDDEVVIAPGKSMDGAITEFAQVSPNKVYVAFLAEALTQAMLSEGYKN